MCSSDMTLTERNFDTLNFGTEAPSTLAVNEDGLLYYRKVSALGRFTNWWSGDKEVKKVNEAILDVLSDLSARFGEFQVRNKTVGMGEIEKLLLKRLRGAPLPMYDPNCLRNYKKLQYLLVPELEDLEARGPGDGDESKLDLAVAKAKLMFKIGVGIDYNTGSSGSFRIKWFGGRPLGIFKPENSKGQLTKRIVNYVNWLWGNQVSHLSAAELARPSAEVAAYLIDRFLEVGITCPTRIVELEAMMGSFQLFEHDMKDAVKIRPSLDNKPLDSFHPRETLLFAKMAMEDFLLAGLDRHDGNWMVQEQDEECLIGLLRLIDNANCFPTENPEPKMLSDIKQYVWKHWKLAKVPFADEVRQLMLRLTDDLATEMINLVRERLPEFWESTMMSLFYQRAAVLRTMARIEGCSPKDLGDLQTDDEILTFLRQPFQEMYIYNYLLGDLLEKASMAFGEDVSEMDEANLALNEIFLNNSFLHRDPLRKNCLESNLAPWGDWGTKEQSFCEMAFTQKSLNLMKSLSGESMEGLANRFRLKLGDDCDESLIEAMLRRAQVLESMAKRENISPKSLEGLLSKEAIDRCLMTSEELMAEFFEVEK